MKLNEYRNKKNRNKFLIECAEVMQKELSCTKYKRVQRKLKRLIRRGGRAKMQVAQLHRSFQ